MNTLIAKALRVLADALESATTAPVPTFTPPCDVLTCEGAADLLHMHPKVIARRAKDGILPAMKVGRSWRFRRTDLLAWLEEQRAGRDGR